MSTVLIPKPIEYPSSDGKPMADNTLQFRWIVKIQGGLDHLFRDDPNVFVAGDLLWYPVEGMPNISAAPDTMVVFGRPKGDRLSYRQWEEGNLAPQVVFDVLSRSNTYREMMSKLDFYDDHGVEEYYVIDPDDQSHRGYYREGAIFRPVRKLSGWTSPLLKVRIEIGDDLVLYGPDGTPLLEYGELAAERDRERKMREDSEAKYRELVAKLRSGEISINDLPVESGA
jgi:Uma2 family endonuclease